MHAYANKLGKFSTHSQKHLNLPPLTLKTQKRKDMLRKQTFALTLFLCFLALTANAAPIDVKEAQEIAENFFKNLPQARGKSMVPRLQPLQPLQRMQSLHRISSRTHFLCRFPGWLSAGGPPSLCSSCRVLFPFKAFLCSL